MTVWKTSQSRVSRGLFNNRCCVINKPMLPSTDKGNLTMTAILAIFTALVCSTSFASDGTVNSPKIGMHYISIQSDPDGVCRQIGYKRAIPGTMNALQISSGRSVSIGYGHHYNEWISAEYDGVVIDRSGQATRFTHGKVIGQLRCQ